MNSLNRILFTSMAILGLLSSASSGFDSKEFAALKPEDQLAIILAALQERDVQLSNVEYEMSEIYSAKEAGIPDKVLCESNYRVRRLDKNWYYRIQRKFPGKKLVSSELFWDGIKALGLAKAPDGSDIANVYDKLPDYVPSIYYNHMLGFERLDNHLSGARSTSMPVADYIERRCMSRHCKYSFQWLPDDPAAPIRLVLKYVNTTEQYLLDPMHGFMLLQYSFDDVNGNAFNKWGAKVTETKDFEGIRVPTKVEFTVSNSGSKTIGSNNFQLTNFKRGGVVLGDVTPKLAAGTEIVDYANNKAYEVLKNGEHEEISLFDSNTGRLLSPATRPSEKARRGPDGLGTTRPATQ